MALKSPLSLIAGAPATPPGASTGPRAPLSRVAAGTFVLRVCHLGLTFLIGLALARLLGAGGYGAFAYAISWVTLLVVPAQLGFNKLLVREVAGSLAKGDWAHLRGIVRLADGLVLAVALIAAGLAVGLSYWLPVGDAQMAGCFRLGMALLPLMALVHIKRATLEGLHRVRTGQLPEMVIHPLALLTLVVLGWAWLGPGLTARLALTAAVVAVGLAALVAAVAVHQLLPREATAQPPRYAFRAWLSSALPFMAIGAMTVITNRTDVVMLGLLRGAADAGVYEIAVRLARLVPFALFVLNSVVAPQLAQFHAEGQHASMQRTLTRAAHWSLALALPAAVVFWVAGEVVLGIFGPAFAGGYMALAILAGGQLVNVAAGCSGHTLMMGQRERDAAYALVLAVMLNVSLNLALIPPYGIEGAAVATSISLVVWKLLMVRQVVRRLGLNPTALAWGARS